MYPYKPDPNLLPVMPGTKLFYVDTGDYSINEDTAEGIAVFPDRLCAMIAGDVVDLNGPYFLSRREAESWISANRSPTLEELLDAAEWHDGFPKTSGRYYVRLIDRNGITQFRPAYYDKENEVPDFYRSPSGGAVGIPGITGWTDHPAVEVRPWQGTDI